jgi:hypothetical protein
MRIDIPLHFGELLILLANMQTSSITIPSPDEIISVSSTKAQNQHGKAIDDALARGNGFARVTKYRNTEYIVLSTEAFERIRRKALEAVDPDPDAQALKKLSSEYRRILKKIQSPTTAHAFSRLSAASDVELGSAVKVANPK